MIYLMNFHQHLTDYIYLEGTILMYSKVSNVLPPSSRGNQDPVSMYVPPLLQYECITPLLTPHPFWRNMRNDTSRINGGKGGH